MGDAAGEATLRLGAPGEPSLHVPHFSHPQWLCSQKAVRPGDCNDSRRRCEEKELGELCRTVLQRLGAIRGVKPVPTGRPPPTGKADTPFRGECEPDERQVQSREARMRTGGQHFLQENTDDVNKTMFKPTANRRGEHSRGVTVQRGAPQGLPERCPRGAGCRPVPASFPA